MAQDSPNWLMADRLAEGNLDQIVAGYVADERNWQWISDRLRRDFGIEVTRVTLRKWYGNADAVSGAA